MTPSDPANSSNNSAGNDRNSPNYLLQFGFLQAPFSSQIDDNMYYADPGQKQRLDLMLHLTQFSEDVLILTGKYGSGKTTLAYQFLQQAHSSWHTCLIAATKTMHGTQLLRQINQCFRLQSQSQILEQMLVEVKGLLSDKLSDPGTHILLVDDAHNLNAETLSVLLELANVRDRSDKLQLHLLLLAEPQIKNKLLEPEAAPSRHTKIRKLEIPPLNRFHADALINFRLRVAGCEDRIFSDKVLTRIFKETDGIPGRLCAAAHEYLMQQTDSTTQQQHGSSSAPGTWFKRGLILAAAVAGAVLLFYQDQFNQYFKHSQTHKQTSSELVDKKLALPELAEQAPHTVVAEQNVAEPNESEQSVPQTSAAEDSTNLEDSGKRQNPPPDNTRFDHLSAEVPDALEKKRSDALEKIQSQLKKLERKRREKPASQQPVIAKLAPPVAPPAASSQDDELAGKNHEQQGAMESDGPVLFPATEQSLKLQQRETKPTPQQAKPKTVAKSTKALESKPKLPPPAPNPLALAHDEQWIRQQSPNNFTLQLISGYQLNTLRRFIKKHKLAHNELSYYLSYNKQGKAWHSLIYGSYPDLKSARNAAQALTRSSTIKQPWIRKFSKIHGDLRTR